VKIKCDKFLSIFILMTISFKTENKVKNNTKWIEKKSRNKWRICRKFDSSNRKKKLNSLNTVRIGIN